jgi:uncharacterized membrane protein
MNFPLHPALVHFPIAFLYGALILHSIHLWRPNWICRVVGMWLLGLAATISIFAAMTGEREVAKAGQMGYSTEIDSLAFAFLLLLVTIVSFTSYLGGQLVWVHGVGTP